MLYMARFKNTDDGEPLSAIVVDADDAEEAAALAQIAAEGLRPDALHEIPAGVFCAEVRFADPEGDDAPDDEGPENPANFSSELVVLEPFGPLAEWLSDTDDAPLGAEDGSV